MVNGCVTSDEDMEALVYLEFADRLRRSGIGTAASHQRRALESAEEVEVVANPWVGESPSSGVGQLLRGRSALKQFDLAHCNLFGPGSLAVARAAKRRDVPLIVHAHVTAEDFQNSFRGSSTIAPVLRRYLRWFYSRADLVLCPSEHTKRRLETYPITPAVEPVSNGVDRDALDGFEQLRDQYRDRFDLDGTVVFTVGNVFERKGLSAFCELARDLDSADPESGDFQFAWFGPYDTGPLASKTVRRWVTQPPDNVVFTGWVEDIRGAFGAGDIYLFPTHEENQGIAALEAMACGKPVVLRDLDVFREYYTDGEDCLLCETRADFERALRRLSEDPDLAARLGQNARETAAEHSLEEVQKRLSSIYREQLRV